MNISTSNTATGLALVAAMLTSAAIAQTSSTVIQPNDASRGTGSPVVVDAGIYTPGEVLATNEMRISFMGTSFLPRLTQAANSVFVECGNGESFVFDCGAGVIEKYVAMGVAYSRMDKIFLTHLHADHESDLSFIYCFGPSTDRKTPLHVWGPTGDTADDGVTNFCNTIKTITEWHRESFSFLSTGLTNGLDGYTLIPHECPYTLVGNLVYNTNGVRITHFPAIHDRNGGISFRLEWQGIAMVFSGDSQPNTFMLSQATNLDVLIHEVTLPPEVWAAKNGSGLPVTDPRFPGAVATAKKIQDCSHTPAKALGYMLHQLSLSNAAPRLAVATHCQFEDDTTNTIMTYIRSWYPGPVTLVQDLQVLNISTDKSQPIRQRTAVVSSDAFYAAAVNYPTNQLAAPNYTNNMMQLSAWLQGHIIPESAYTNPPPLTAPRHHSPAADVEITDSPFSLDTPPATNQMRISFMGTSVVPRLSQAANSVFVECGNGENFVFDCGSGVIEKFVAAGVAYSQMDKILLTHLHGDHMSDLMFMYCFGPSTDRFTPLYVWGPTGPSTNAPQGPLPNEGITNFCAVMRAMTHWHRESFSFLSTGLTNGLDGYDLVPYECPYELIGNVVYNTNGVRITHFPAIHDRDGAISFRLEWQGISMAFSGDTRPNTFMLNQATNLDVLIHEVTLSPEFWAAKNTGRSPGDPVYEQALITSRMIQDCSHTPAKALGYMLNKLEESNAAPRLAVATHCQFEEDTTNAVMTDIRSWYLGPVSLVKDLQVITVSTDKSQPIQQGILSYSSNAFYAHKLFYAESQLAPPKYTNNMMQFSSYLLDHVIPARLYSTLYADIDMDADGKTDPAFYNLTNGLWAAMLSAYEYEPHSVSVGGPGYIAVPGDYDWDRQIDPAIYQESTGLWVVLLSGSDYEPASTILGGGADYIPVPGDYDGDRKADPAVYRESTREWLVMMSGSDYELFGNEFGPLDAGYTPVARDYDGDGKIDLAFYQESTGIWYFGLSASGYALYSTVCGGPGYTPVPGDYDGDGKTDPGVYRRATGYWLVMQSCYGYTLASTTLGGEGYAPAPGDFDADQKTDMVVYRESTGEWLVMMSGSGYGIFGTYFGGPGDSPVWLCPSGY
ncbi:MAG: MBL fold metallo-hydrolase [Kiritimatiellae bacterium]|nr:MBL fold metallo-hydrolase [Kiritimatiellia bacterium]